MEALFAWFSNLVNFFGNFIPRIRICRITHKGIKFVQGKEPKVISPGIFIYWPIVTEYVLHPVVFQVQNLPAQVVQSEDGKAYLCDGCLAYEIEDIFKFVVNNEEAVQGIQQLGLAAIRETLARKNVQILKIDDLDYKLTCMCANLINEQFGIKIIYAKLGSLAPATVIHLSGGLDSTSSIYTSTQ